MRAEARQLLVLRWELNAGAMCDEQRSEEHREAVASPRRRKPTRGKANSQQPDQSRHFKFSGLTTPVAERS
ncbi:hypothetical protein A3C68_00460 [Candidatus Kuenenbacteria bacterium RIFCSPHIGHO2_02_FULL_42_29]|nr:MAG: hypothetical protein A3C68_00460 [Candidatus Kuenenbacteria bacterium RIFCSPHIGHO2_02_FULL_42_29]